ncbi:MAG: ABC transporter ATP-binding protein [Pseudomonadales bacterium]
MKLLLEFVRQHPVHSLVLVLLLMVAGAADGIGFSMLVPILNLAVSGESTADANATNLESYVVTALDKVGIDPSIGLLLCFMVVAIAIKSILIFTAELRIGYVAAEITTDLRIRLLRAIADSRWEYFTEQPGGRLANALSTEAVRASSAFVFGVRFLSVFVEVVVYAILALLVSWQATLVCLAAAVLVFTVANQFVAISRRAGARQTLLNRSLLSSLTDVLQSVKAIKAMGRSSATEELLASDTDGLRKALKKEALGKASLLSAPETLNMAVLGVGIYVALVVFSFEVASVLFLVVILNRMMRRMGKLQRNFQHMTTTETAYWSIVESIDQASAKRETLGGHKAPSLQRQIQLSNIHLTFKDKVVLERLSLSIPVNQLTCLVGASGTGKSSIADLILGFVEADQGQLLIDDVPLSELNLRQWRQCIGYVSQDNLLLNDTVYNNVAIGIADASAESVAQALEAAGATEFVAQLDGGVDALVGERGSRLSGGQRQRILIARAIVHQPMLLILDEATSALDESTERAIMQTLIQLKQSMTILSVSHRPSAIGFADHVYRLVDGGIADAETPISVSESIG